MFRLRPICVAILVTALLLPAESFSAAPAKPKLVVAIIVDQFRYDYLTRFRDQYHAGFDQLLTRGADFTNAFYVQVPTVTAVGHSLFMSGAMPAVSGIIGNSWYDRDEQKVVTSVCDWEMTTVGAAQVSEGKKCTDADPASPRRLLVSTLGDELRNAHEQSKVIGVSIKARGAILPSGHRAAGAFWFDDASGNFVTSSFYMKQLPAWASHFNSEKRADQYLERRWDGFPSWNFHAPDGSREPYSKLPASPWGNELIEQFAEAALSGENLGRGTHTDLLTVSFSSNDYVGHQVGPDAPEVQDMAIRTDQLLGKLFKAIDSSVGLENTLIVLSADHGVAPTPAQDEANKMPGGYIAADVEEAVTSALNRKFGKADWLIAGVGDTSLYFNQETVSNFKSAEGKSISRDEITEAAKTTLLSIPQLHVVRVYTRAQLENGSTGDFIAQAETNGYFERRSGDLSLVFEPGYVPGTAGTSHFSPYAYDSHVPVLFMGPGIKAGRYNAIIQVNDIAATLATMLDVQTPSGSSGRILTEMLVR